MADPRDPADIEDWSTASDEEVAAAKDAFKTGTFGDRRTQQERAQGYADQQAANAEDAWLRHFYQQNPSEWARRELELQREQAREIEEKHHP
jgi:hypothetical protein